ncbi:hypothetical protein MH117_06580 [Paenibacillus sp. ACRRX]|uniref:hypothetical protein n=1 Tax=Paenibacillus sp. ACRRX TaxID=2918206 RepID=UPI001EF44157|nr:hypothetical protein [Paenibacillus sp. ACRRX]MCG7407077.1 hypothetical protein [Paenibacillus sp. ACRRX]
MKKGCMRLDSDVLLLSLDQASNIPLLSGGTVSFQIYLQNKSPNAKLYNVSLLLKLPDGISYSTASLPPTTIQTNSDGSSQLSWVSMKDLAPHEPAYVFTITVSGNPTYKNGAMIPFGTLLTGTVVTGQADTQPRGSYDNNNLKITEQKVMSFLTTRYTCQLTAPSKALKGAGTAVSSNNYLNPYTISCRILNNATVSSSATITIQLPDGIRYIGALTSSGTDAAQFLQPTVSSPLLPNNYTQLSFQSRNLSAGSDTTVSFKFAIWNQYQNNLGPFLLHGSPLTVSAVMSTDQNQLVQKATVIAMDIVVTTAIDPKVTDVQSNVQLTFNYQTGQYYTLNLIQTDYFLPDGFIYVSSSEQPTNIINDASRQGTTVRYLFSSANPETIRSIVIRATVDAYYRYRSANQVNIPITAGDDFKPSVALTAANNTLHTNVSDQASTSASIVTGTIFKQFIGGAYRNGTPKSIKALAPGDLAKYRLTYNATTIRAVQKSIVLDDFFPLAANPIQNLTYNFTGPLPLPGSPQLIDPHGVDFQYGDIPGRSTSTIEFQVPIQSLGGSGQNTNLMKLTGSNSFGFTYSSRDQVVINIGTPNLTLTKTVQGPNRTGIKAGEVYTFSVVIRNSNTLGTETDAFSLVVQDNLSAWYSLIPATIKVTGTGSYDVPQATDSLITWPVMKLGPGQALTLSYSVTISSTLPPGLTISTTVTSSNPYSQLYEEGQVNFQYSGLNRSASVTLASPAITIAKTYPADLLKVNSTVDYTINATVPQGTIAYDVRAADLLPANQQVYVGKAFYNGIPITPTVTSNTITFPGVRTIDARIEKKTLTYSFRCSIINANKAVGATTSQQTNTAQVTYRYTDTGTNVSLNRSTGLTIQHPNIVLTLTATSALSGTFYAAKAVVDVNEVLIFKLAFVNNSAVALMNGTISLPIPNGFVFNRINTNVQCTSSYSASTRKITISVPSLSANASGFMAFTVALLPTMRSGSSLTLQATAVSYTNDISSKVYGGEQSNAFVTSLPPGTSLLPSPTDRINDSTSFRVTPPGSTAIITNFFRNTGGGYDDYTLSIAAVSIAYSLLINGQRITTVPPNTAYSADLSIMSNLEPNESRIISIESTIPANSSLGSRYDFVVTARSKTTPNPQKTVLNIDPF